MNELVRDNLSTTRKIWWGSVFAGVVVVLVAQLSLTLLGLAIGAGSVHLAERDPIDGLGWGTVVWLAVTSLLSLFAGGWVSGRLAAVKNNVDSMLHGVVTWGLASLVSFMLLTSAAGKILSGAAGVVGSVVSASASGVKAAAPEVTRIVSDHLGLQGQDLSALTQEVRKVLVQTKKPELQPNNLERRAEQVGSSAEDAAAVAGKNPQLADTEVTKLIDRIFAQGKTAIDAADKTALVNVLVARTEMTRAEASRTVDNWQAAATTAAQKVTETAQKAEQAAREAADATAHGVSTAAAWAFVCLLLGLAAGAAGGWLGAPEHTPLRLRSIDRIIPTAA